jgi:hypothetical protein
MDSDGRPRHRAGVVLAAVCLAVSAGFACSLWTRAPEWGRLHPTLAGWHTAGSVVFASHWRAEGPWRVAWAMLWAPPSVAQPELRDRMPYTSFGAGSVVPLYAVSMATGVPPGPAMAWGLSLAVQWAVALGLAVLAWRLGRDLGLGAGGAVPVDGGPGGRAAG